jgi:sRNA-binding carbon storage regulator CsrA
VRLGFEAKKGVPAHKEEVCEQIRTSRLRNPPTGGPDRTESRNADEKAGVLSGVEDRLYQEWARLS